MHTYVIYLNIYEFTQSIRIIKSQYGSYPKFILFPWPPAKTTINTKRQFRFVFFFPSFFSDVDHSCQGPSHLPRRMIHRQTSNIIGYLNQHPKSPSWKAQTKIHKSKINLTIHLGTIFSVELTKRAVAIESGHWLTHPTTKDGKLLFFFGLNHRDYLVHSSVEYHCEKVEWKKDLFQINIPIMNEE